MSNPLEPPGTAVTDKSVRLQRALIHIKEAGAAPGARFSCSLRQSMAGGEPPLDGLFPARLAANVMFRLLASSSARVFTLPFFPAA